MTSLSSVGFPHSTPDNSKTGVMLVLNSILMWWCDLACTLKNLKWVRVTFWMRIRNIEKLVINRWAQCWKFLSNGRPSRSGLGLGDLHSNISWFTQENTLAVKSRRFLHWTRNFLRSIVTMNLPWPFKDFLLRVCSQSRKPWWATWNSRLANTKKEAY